MISLLKKCNKYLLHVIYKQKVVDLKVCGNGLVLSKLTQGGTLLSCIQEESLSNLSHNTELATNSKNKKLESCIEE
jgi:hypothetical protein